MGGASASGTQAGLLLQLAIGGHMAAQRFQTPFQQLYPSFDVVYVKRVSVPFSSFDEGSAEMATPSILLGVPL